MDAKERSIFSEYAEDLAQANPVTKLVWLVLLMAIKGKSKVISFSRKRGKQLITIKLDYKHECVPPPRHMFSPMINLLRRIGRNNAKNEINPFHFIYIEREKEQKLYWFIDHDKGLDSAAQLKGLMQEICKEEEDRLELELKNYARSRRRYWSLFAFIVIGTGGIVIMSAAIITNLISSLF